MKQKQIIIAIFATALLLASSSGYGAESETKAALADEEFIFTFSAMGCYTADPFSQARIDEIKEMMGTGMTHVNIRVYPSYPTDTVLRGFMQQLQKYDFIQDISPGGGVEANWSGMRNELVATEADNGEQFLSTPCIKDNKGICENWNSLNLVNPAYQGTLWENTLTNTKNAVKKLNAIKPVDLVFFDTEIWWKPENLHVYYESKDPGQNCPCGDVVETAIGIQNYYSEWKQRGLDLKNAVKSALDEINLPAVEVGFYNEVPNWQTRYIPEADGSYAEFNVGAMPSGSGDFAGPSLYVLPNLEALEMNLDSMDLQGAIAYISPTYTYGYSNYFSYSYTYTGEWLDDIFFDTSVSREAGRMLRKEGLKGFYVYPNIYIDVNFHGSYVHDYWLAHAKALIDGFKEDPAYVETNKIRNPDFEAFKIKAAGHDITLPDYVNNRGSSLIGPIQFAPVFWTWTDSYSSYGDNANYATLVQDKQSGTYSWKHTRNGAQGSRTIYSRDFSIAGSETGNYRFSIQTKASIDSSNSTIAFSLVNTNTLEEQDLGYTGFARDWTEFKKDIDIAAGNYKIKILLQDNTQQTVDIFLDNASFEKATACGNGECEAALGETVATCPADCKCGNGTCETGLNETFETCPADCPSECVDTPTLMNQYIPQWKSGAITMLTLMQRMKQWNRTGCPI